MLAVIMQLRSCLEKMLDYGTTHAASHVLFKAFIKKIILVRLGVRQEYDNEMTGWDASSLQGIMQM